MAIRRENCRIRSKIYAVFSLSIIVSVSSVSAGQGQHTEIKDQLKNAIEVFNEGNYEESKSILSQLTTKYPENALVWFNLGNTDFMLGNYGDAIKAYKNVERLKSDLSIASKLYIVKSLRKLSQCKEAAASIRSVSGLSMTPGIEADFYSEKTLVSRCLLKKGFDLYKEESYAESIEYFDTVLAFTDDPNAQMMKGLALLKSGDASEARSSFKRILDYPDNYLLNEEFRNFAQNFVKEIDDGKWMLTYDHMLRLSLRAGYNSNAYRVEPDEYTDNFARGFLSLSMDSAYRFFKRPSFSIFLTNNFFYEEIIGLSDLRLIENVLSVPMIYHKGSFLIRGNIVLDYAFLESRSFFLKTGPQLIFQYGEKYVLGSSYSYLRDFSLNRTYEYLEGNYHDLSVYGGLDLGALFLRPGFKLIADDTGDLVKGSSVIPLANISYGFTFLLNWAMSEKWVLKSTNNFLFRDYDNISMPGSMYRNDKQWQGDLSIFRILSDDKSIFLDLTNVINRSSMGSASIEDKNYHQIIMLVGFSWNLLK